MSVICPSRASSSPRLSRGFSTAAASGQHREKSTAFKGADKRMANGLFALEPANMRLLYTPWIVCSAQACGQSFFVFHRAIPHNSKCRYGERGAAATKPKAQIILDAAKVSAASGGCSEPKQGQRSQSARGLCPRSTMRVPQPDIIEHFGSADAVPQLPERCLSRKAGIVRCCLKKKRTIPTRSGERTLQGKNSSLFFHHIPLRKIFPCFGQDFAGAGLNVIGGQREVSAVGAS